MMTFTARFLKDERRKVHGVTNYLSCGNIFGNRIGMRGERTKYLFLVQANGEEHHSDQDIRRDRMILHFNFVNITFSLTGVALGSQAAD